MDLISLGVFIGALFINAGTPGPSVVALVSRVISNGCREVLPFTLAMWIGEVLWLTVALAGLSTIALKFHVAFLVLKWAGVAYLCWLAVAMWRRKSSPDEDDDESIPRRRTSTAMFGAGMALTLGNPKIMVFYVALLPTLIDISHPGVATWAVLAAATATTLAVVDVTWMAVASRLRLLLRSPRMTRLANRVSAMALGGAAAVIATKH
ncbi:LysE family translocator [Haloglycomyces albus]|uniref:LysE family translocator n=1 Tax=Haloglycomyces albus TaxID=526067 RepID=UPI00046CC4BA|nr:LysE family translocator [Haloglycomyces albus]